LKTSATEGGQDVETRKTNEKATEAAAGGPSSAPGAVTGTQLISGNLYRLPNEKLDAYCPAGALTFRRFFI
jgi:hypothetical protein